MGLKSLFPPNPPLRLGEGDWGGMVFASSTPSPGPFSEAVRGRKTARVCFVIDRLSRAGTESQLLALIRNLDRTRVEPTLCLLNGQDDESRALLPTDCPMIDLGLIRLLGGRAMSAAIKLRAFWERHRVNIVQAYFLDSAYFSLPLARLCGIQHTIRVRNNSGYWLTARHRWLGRMLGRLVTTLSNSEIARQAVIEAERLNPSRVRVIENGVDLDRFQNVQPPDTATPLVRIGAVANLRQVKNIDGLIRVAASICKTHPQTRFLVAGEGGERPQLEAKIRHLGLSGRFELIGSVEDVPGFLADLDIAVNCSHSESMSNAVLEYMAAGRAIVATDVGAHGLLIRNELEGLVVAATDDAALELAIRRYLLEPIFARSCAYSARVRAERDFSRLVMVREFEEFFASLLQKKRPARTGAVLVKLSNSDS